MSNLYFVTYASGRFKKNIFWNKVFVNLFIRPKNAFYLTDSDLKKDSIYTKNREIFDANVGGGFWAWKPWAILKVMENSEENDIIIYQDCGTGFKYKNFVTPKNIIEHAKIFGAMPGVFIPIHGVNKQWTHARCFKNMECEEDCFYNTPQVEASISAWTVSKENRAFIQEWLEYCLNKEVVSDLVRENVFGVDETFKAHRYDQSILTNLVVKYKKRPIKLEFDDMHFSKSLSLVDLSLEKRNPFKKLVFKIVLILMRVKRWIQNR